AGQAALEEKLRQAIEAGRLRAGAAVPSTRALAQELGLSRGTVVTAYGELVAAGYLRTRPGGETTVVSRPGPAVPSGCHGKRIPQVDPRPGAPGRASLPE